jgi:hypothetical protein
MLTKAVIPAIILSHAIYVLAGSKKVSKHKTALFSYLFWN